ncbi:MAG TPA: hypothetical protein VGT79_07125 [Xanthomonadaceae bacterium]|nr:hypothetical protein [Xanthomonadaceae bacterium]
MFVSMNRMEKCILAIVLFGAVIVDPWLFSLRCDLGPPVAWSPFFLGLLIQVIAVAVPFTVARVMWDEPAGRRLKYCSMAILLFVGSLLMVKDAILFSDAIGKGRGFQSRGLRCPVPPLVTFGLSR